MASQAQCLVYKALLLQHLLYLVLYLVFIELEQCLEHVLLKTFRKDYANQSGALLLTSLEVLNVDSDELGRGETLDLAATSDDDPPRGLCIYILSYILLFDVLPVLIIESNLLDQFLVSEELILVEVA